MKPSPPASPPVSTTDRAPSDTVDPLLVTWFGDGEAAARAAALEALVERPWATPGRLSQALHDGLSWPALEAGEQVVEIPVGHGRVRQVLVRVPRGYTPERPWPLVLAYHGSGGSADSFLGRIEPLLGDHLEEYVVAVPHHYRQTVLDHPPPVSSEHAEVVRSLRQLVHVDSDRIYVTGFSLGGYTAWFLATMHPDLFAAALPLASAFAVPADVDGLWEMFLPNLRHLPVLSVWGGRDTMNVPGLNGRRSRDTMAGLNRRLAGVLERQGPASITHVERPRKGHGGIRPSRAQARDFFTRERVHAPARILHRFRWIHQAQAYWVEGHRWRGPGWTDPWPPVDPRRGESREDALERTLGDLIGMIDAHHEGQTFRLSTHHLADLTVWIGEGMIDWDQPVTVWLDDRRIFEGTLQPDPALALVQARRTRDLDRLWWAGIRVDVEAGTGRPVTARDELPPVLREVTP